MPGSAGKSAWKDRLPTCGFRESIALAEERIAEIEAIEVGRRTPKTIQRSLRRIGGEIERSTRRRSLASTEIAATNALGEAASAVVEQYAPAAPQALKDEAVIRFAGYLAQSDFGAIAKESIGPRDIEYVTTHQNAWRNCGAGMLLSRWKIRRAGSIG